MVHNLADLDECRALARQWMEAASSLPSSRDHDVYLEIAEGYWLLAEVEGNKRSSSRAISS